ncbi:hypothetical protein QOZ80_8BG0642810 [Eleusine coracana subsp. coracana]|nr:hypothetical protein QOZ80_8BG0642810 [Eleusine coracana subsp. coracana]
MLPTKQMTTHSTSSSKPPTDGESALLDRLQKQRGKTNQQAAGTGSGRERRKVVLAAAAADVCLAGAGLLAWWALAFHPSYGQLWMVPVGLVLACTPVVVCVALHFSPAAADPPPGKAGAGAPPQLSAVVVVVGK